MSDTRTDFVPLAPVRLVRPNGQVRSFGLGAASDVARGTALTNAVNDAAAGETVVFGPGDYDIAGSALDLQTDGPIHLIGPGKLAATISSGNTATPLVQMGSGSYAADFSLTGTSSSQQTPFGATAGQAAFTDAMVHRVSVTQPVDCIFLFSANASSIRFYECDLFGEFDCVRVASAAHLVELFHCRVIASGPTTANQLRALSAIAGTVNAYNCQFVGEGMDDGSNSVVAAWADGTSTVRLYGCQCSTSNASGSGSQADLARTSSGVLEIDAGTTYDRTKVAGAIVGRPVRVIQLQVVAPTADVATGDGAAYFHVPAALNGGVITAAHAAVIAPGITGTTDVQIANIRSGTPVDVLSTKLTIDSGETGSDTAATPAVINAANDDLATNDRLRVDVDAVSTTAPTGLIVTLEVTL